MEFMSCRRHAHSARLLVVLLAVTLPWVAWGIEEPATAAAQEPTREPAAGQEQPRNPVRRLRPIFVCRDATPVIFADRPCGQFFEARDLRVVEPAPGAAATTTPQPAAATTKPRAQPRKPDDGTDDEARCRQLLDERDRLDDRMRAGYPARQAAQLLNRWHELRTEIYAARC